MFPVVAKILIKTRKVHFERLIDREQVGFRFGSSYIDINVNGNAPLCCLGWRTWKGSVDDIL